MTLRIKNDIPEIRVYGDNVEQALKIFRRRMDAAGIIQELKNRRQNPSGKMRSRHKRYRSLKRANRRL